MSGLLNPDFENHFVAYSLSHWVTLSIFATLVLLLYMFRGWFRKGDRERKARYTLACILVLCELTLNSWFAWTRIYSVTHILPLELCSISLYMCIVMLLFNSRKVFQVVYFTGIGGAMMALLTPELSYAFPHFRFIQFFVAHIGIILAILYMVWVKRFRPTLKSIAVTMVFLNVLLVLVGGVNLLTGANYMFLAGKPDTPSLLDVLGPHPWYILSLEVVALFLFLLLYLPFAIFPRKKGKRKPISF